MKKKLLGLLFSLSLAGLTLFSLTGCALKSSCDMKNGQSCHMDGKEKSCNCDMKSETKASCDMKKDGKGSCSSGKCGAEMKKETKGSCGAGKCGAEMKNDMKDKATTK
jgi:uncharacterized low-complexity protein